MATPVTHEPPRPASREGVRSDNWCEPPYNRWGFRHVRELTRTARVRRGEAAVRPLPERVRPLGGLQVLHGGDRFTVETALEAAYTDSFVVVHDDAVVYEWYAPGMTRHTNHLVMSVSKSLTSTLVGSLVGDGFIEVAGFAHTYVPELVGTSWEGATVQHLLDMTAAVRFDEEDYDNPLSDGCLIEWASGYTIPGERKPAVEGLPPDTVAWILSLPPQGVHGDRFQYRSIITDVLGWVVESVTGERFADVFSERIWQRIGAEHDADLIVDERGFPAVEGGFCTTARDLARVGLLHLHRGMVGGARVIPAEWTDRILCADPVLVEHYRASSAGDPATPDAYYHDCWWVDATAGRYGGHGINGQRLVVDRPTGTVIAQHSTWPHRWDPPLAALQDAVQEVVLSALART